MGLAILQLQGIKLKGGLIPEVWELIHRLTAAFIFTQLLFTMFTDQVFVEEKTRFKKMYFKYLKVF